MKVITTNLLNRFWKNGVKPIKEAVTGKLDASKVVNSLLATEEGFALDATQGKALKDQVDELNRKLTYVKTDISQNLKVYREGRRVTVQGLVLINGTSTTFELPYTATDVTRFSAVGLSNSLALAGYSFGTVKGAACEITFGNAITYAAVNFAYYTNL